MMLHPATAHFAIALPVVALVFGVIYLFTRSEGMSKISTRAFVLAALGVVAAWYTGSQAGPDAYPLLSSEGQHELLKHKTLGIYLAVSFAVIALIKFAGCKMNKFGIEALAVLLLIGATATIFVQGKDGGELTYVYGAGVEKHADGLDCLANPGDYVEDEAASEEEDGGSEEEGDIDESKTEKE